jgi:hypothetical protein
VHPAYVRYRGAVTPWTEPIPPTVVLGLDPLDPSTSRHAGQFEPRDTTDPALLRLLLKVQDGADPGYWWVTCGACETSWQVWHYAAESAG